MSWSENALEIPVPLCRSGRRSEKGFKISKAIDLSRPGHSLRAKVKISVISLVEDTVGPIGITQRGATSCNELQRVMCGAIGETPEMRGWSGVIALTRGYG